MVFFLLHEQPEDVRRKTIQEAIRVTRPGGKIIFVDYHRPRAWHPLRLVMKPILHWLDPFAMDLWKSPLAAGIAAEFQRAIILGMAMTPFIAALITWGNHE